MQTEGRDASLRAIFAEVQLILCKSKTIKTKRQTFNLCFLHSFTQSRARGSKSTRKKGQKNDLIKNNQKNNQIKMRPHKNVTAPWLQMMLLGW